MLVDEVTIKVEGGRGGSGKAAFGEHKLDKRPSGGDGGNGGSVYIVSGALLDDLSRYRFEKYFKAGDGVSGLRFKNGEEGKDVVLEVPRGTIVTNRTTGEPPFEVIPGAEPILVARGGIRGRGNRSFSHARGAEFKRFDLGKPGYSAELHLELQLIADIGLVGLPNAGKSSLLNAITGARSKVGAYKFTTLEPSLGVLGGEVILADIPGLIEGASEGKGLGSKFLRHVKRTTFIAHCVSAESEDVTGDYKTIRKELKAFDPELAAKPEYIILTKTDLSTPAEIKKILTKLKKLSPHVSAVSVYDDPALRELSTSLSKFFHEQKSKQ